ncbi:MAG: chromate transporter [Sphingobacteriales bacterium]
MRKRHFLFLRDVFVLTFTAFGGPQAHLAMMLNLFVLKRKYLSEEELLEINALCQLLPGPSSTQTLAAISYKFGKAPLTIATLAIWLIPLACVMCFAAITVTYYQNNDLTPEFGNFVQPMAVGIVGFSAFILAKRLLKSSMMWIFMSVSAVLVFVFKSAFLFPILIIFGAFLYSFLNRKLYEKQKVKLQVNWRRIGIMVGILLISVFLGAELNRNSYFSLPIRLFENFYRNGILIFGGGQVLIPYMFTEFVQMKSYLTGNEFLTGLAIQQSLPGPVFAFSSFIGGLSMREYGTAGQIFGSFVALLGINLPGILLIMIIIPLWDKLKNIQHIRRSLDGINAIAIGFVIAAFGLLLQPIGYQWQPLTIVGATILILIFTKIPIPLLILGGFILGVIF